MNAVDTYKKAKRALECSELWFGRIGKRYNGGGGGIGKIVEFKIANVTIYYQHSDGDTNYHEIPAELKPFLATVIAKGFPDLIKNAITLQMENLQSLADEAQEELKTTMRDAGLEVQA